MQIPNWMDMNKIKVFLLSISVLFTVVTANAQLKKGIDYSGFFDTYYYPNLWSFNAGVGFPLYYGDLCGGLGCNSGSYLSYVVGAGYKPWPKVMIGADFYYTTLGATDVVSTRNISFESKNYELALYGRYYLKDDIIRKHTDMFKKTRVFKPYALLGVSGLYYSPTAVYTDTITGLTTTVNEGVTYPRLGLGIPVGIGASFDLSRRVSILAEAVYRYTFTDLLDGVSTLNGNPGAKDSYMTIDLKVQWTPWAPRVKKKKQKTPKDIPMILGNDSTSANGGGSDSTSSVQEKDSEMDYYEQLLQEEEEKNKPVEAPNDYSDIIDISEEEEEGVTEEGGEKYDEEGYLIEGDPSEPVEEEDSYEEESYEEDSW